MYIVYIVRHNVIAHLIDYSISITFIFTGNQKINLTCFIVVFALLGWSGTKPSVSLKYACISKCTTKIRHPQPVLPIQTD